MLKLRTIENRMKRLFLAVDLPEDVRGQISELLRRMRSRLPSVRWVRPDQLHITLKFLGDTPDDQVERVRDEVHQKLRLSRSFSLSAQGFSAFPSPEKARILWVGLSGEMDQLRQLATRLDECCATLGYPMERRPFSGHITLGRLKPGANPRPDPALFHKMDVGRLGEFRVSEVVLYESDLRPTGPVYGALERFRLF